MAQGKCNCAPIPDCMHVQTISTADGGEPAVAINHVLGLPTLDAITAKNLAPNDCAA